MLLLTSPTRTLYPRCFLFVLALTFTAHLAAQRVPPVPMLPRADQPCCNDIWNHDVWPDDQALAPQAASGPVNGTVSVTRLQHPIPAKAVAEFARANREARKGRIQECVKHLEKAVQIAPSYMEAHNNLGVRYLMLGEYERGAQEFETALKLDASSLFPHTNLSLVRFMLTQYAEAEASARAALRLDAKFTRAQYLLGLTLAAEGKGAAEAIDHLDKAAAEFPRARLVAAEILTQQGASAGAVEKLRAYLTLPDAASRNEVESWLARLER